MLTIRMKFTRSTVAVMRSSYRLYRMMIIRLGAQLTTSYATVALIHLNEKVGSEHIMTLTSDSTLQVRMVYHIVLDPLVNIQGKLF